MKHLLMGSLDTDHGYSAIIYKVKKLILTSGFDTLDFVFNSTESSNQSEELYCRI